ncbi:MAG TPA: PhzF family phenazine biosynthesis protein, partial [Nitrospiria bacterium]
MPHTHLKNRIWIVNAFSSSPSGGNPAAVCLRPERNDTRWMQDVARRMKLSETAFLWPSETGNRLRWFTPETEVDLCGHATLATAHILWETGTLSRTTPARFSTRSGMLTARAYGEWIEMDFPAEPENTIAVPAELPGGLGAGIVYAGENRFDYLVELENEEAVRTLHPDFEVLKTFPVRGIIVTARSDTPGFDFISRFFAPRAGIPEDPVTGSAHCCLGPYWGNRLNKNELTGYQASKRGGTVKIKLEGNNRV